MSKDAYYFSHDANARNDIKITAMRSVYGCKGYGWYWIIVEILREEKEHRLKLNDATFNALAMQMQCKYNASKTFIENCINEYELFTSDGEYFWSNSLLKRMELVDAISVKRSNAASLRWGDANAMQMQCKSNAMKGNEMKRNEIKKDIKEVCRFTPPTPEEVKTYCTERKNKIDPERFIDFYTSKGWKVGKNPMKDWKASIRTWEKDKPKVIVQEILQKNNFEQRTYDDAFFKELEG